MVTQAYEWVSPPTDEDGVLSWLRHMRDRDPVQREPGGGWHIFGYDEVRAVLSNHGAFSSAVVGPLPEDSAMRLYRNGNLTWMDPPRHRQLRGLVSRVFTPRYIADLEPMITATVDEFLTRIRGKDTVAFVDEYASPITSTVIARMMGVTEGGNRLFRQWSRDLMALADPATPKNGLRKVFTNTQVVSAYLHDQIRRRRADPGDDLLTALVMSEVDGERLGDDDIAGLVALLLATGQAATLTQVNAVICLDRHRDAMARLRSDPALLGDAIEEVMRYRNQTMRLDRKTVEDVVVGGHEIPAGQPVAVWLAAANFDGKAFPDPERFDIGRSPNPHLGLGHGIHYCLGTSLARLEIRIALERLLRHTEDFSVDYAESRLLDPRLMFGAHEIALRPRWRD